MEISLDSEELFILLQAAFEEGWVSPHDLKESACSKILDEFLESVKKPKRYFTEDDSKYYSKLKLTEDELPLPRDPLAQNYGIGVNRDPQPQPFRMEYTTGFSEAQQAPSIPPQPIIGRTAWTVARSPQEQEGITRGTLSRYTAGHPVQEGRLQFVGDPPSETRVRPIPPADNRVVVDFSAIMHDEIGRDPPVQHSARAESELSQMLRDNAERREREFSEQQELSNIHTTNITERELSEQEQQEFASEELPPTDLD